MIVYHIIMMWYTCQLCDPCIGLQLYSCTELVIYYSREGPAEMSSSAAIQMLSSCSLFGQLYVRRLLTFG